MFSLQYSKDTSNQLWRALHIFNVYRLIIVGIIASTFFFAEKETTFGQLMPQVFHVAIICWVSLVLASGFTSHFRIPSFHWQVYAFTLTDIAFITLLTYTSGGITSGLGTLLLVTIAASGILVSSHMLFGFAALATLAIFFIQGYLILAGHETSSLIYTQSGSLGAGLFAVALLSHMLSQRIVASEALAEQRQTELMGMSQASKLIIQQMETGVILTDSLHTIQLMNQSAQKLTGHSYNQQGNTLDKVSPELDRQLRSWKENALYEIRPFRISRDNTEILPHFKRIHEGSDLIILIFLYDTSQLSRQAQQSRLASLGQLTASIAHEIRNPLSAISHAGQLLSENQELANDDQRLTKIIQQQSQRLNTIIESILSLSRKREFKPEQINIVDWLIKFKKTIIERSGEVQQSIHLDLPDKPLIIKIDKTHLEQIMYNLFENGMRHSRLNASKQLLNVSCSRNAFNGNIQIDVRDYGQGIPEEYHNRLFEPFFTTDTAGTGLGLYIARELSQLNHGHLQYLPDYTNGTHFRLTVTERS